MFQDEASGPSSCIFLESIRRCFIIASSKCVHHHCGYRLAVVAAPYILYCTPPFLAPSIHIPALIAPTTMFSHLAPFKVAVSTCTQVAAARAQCHRVQPNFPIFATAFDALVRESANYSHSSLSVLLTMSLFLIEVHLDVGSRMVASGTIREGERLNILKFSGLKCLKHWWRLWQTFLREGALRFPSRVNCFPQSSSLQRYGLRSLICD